MRNAWAAGMLVVVGCLPALPVARMTEPTEIAVLYVRDDVFEKRAFDVPPELIKEVEALLGERNLVPLTVATELGALAGMRDSGRRLAHMRQGHPGAPWLMLVETQARFYAQMEGRYKWNVFAKITLRGPEGLERIEELQIPAVLDFYHEREDEALRMAGPGIRRNLVSVLDGTLAPAASTSSSPASMRPAASVYFVMVDRFANGDPGNDVGVDTDDPAAWHGGDLRGLIDRLDYLQDLGVHSVWLSPLYASRTEPWHGHGAFHGYWVEDHNRIDSRFGDWQTLRELSDELHLRNMRLVLDVVLNHVGFEAPLVAARPGWFHAEGGITDWDDPSQWVTRDVHGLPDLAQEREEVYRYLLASTADWIERSGADGLRLDAVKHVHSEFWRRFQRDIARRFPQVQVIGEIFTGDPVALAEAQARHGFTDVFDFPTAFALREIFCDGRSVAELGVRLSFDGRHPAPARLITFVDNHDMPRVVSQCGGRLDDVLQSLTVMFALRGVPAINYGTEVGLAGADEPHNRAPMRFDLTGDSARLHGHVRQLLALRRAHRVLETGATRIISLGEEHMAWLRHSDAETMLVVVNRGADPVEVWPPEGLTPTLDVLTGEPLRTPVVTYGGETRVAVLSGVVSGGAQQHRHIDVVVEGVELAAGEGLWLVGSARELGHWQPESGVGPLSATGDSLAGRLSLAVGSVAAYKLVVRARDGSVRWEGGDNRYVFVSGRARQRLALRWRSEAAG